MGITNRVPEKTYFRPFEIPSKKSLKKAVAVADKSALDALIASMGNFSDIIIEEYPSDKRRSYFRSGTVSWTDNMVITGIKRG